MTFALVAGCRSSKPQPTLSSSEPSGAVTPASGPSCETTASKMARQGTTTPERLKAREGAILKLCIDDAWPEAVRQCVADADHDQISCTSNLETDLQREHWDQIFNDW